MNKKCPSCNSTEIIKKGYYTTSHNHQQFKAKYNKEFDSLFQINHVSAKIRADLSRMRRRTWACTKKWENLQRHLLIYIAWNNKYELNLNWV